MYTSIRMRELDSFAVSRWTARYLFLAREGGRGSLGTGYNPGDIHERRPAGRERCRPSVKSFVRDEPRRETPAN